MKTCEHCGRDNRAAAIRCSRCGRPLGGRSADRSCRGGASDTVVISRGTAWLILGLAFGGWLLVMAEHSWRIGLQSRYNELEGAIAAREGEAAEAKRRAHEIEHDGRALRAAVADLQQNCEALKTQLAVAAELDRVQQGKLAELSNAAASPLASSFPTYQAIKPIEPVHLEPVQPIQYVPNVRGQPLEVPSNNRLANGTQLQTTYGQGNGKLEVANRLSTDAIVKLVSRSDNRSVAQFYVRAGESWQCPAIPDGSYTLYFATGNDYDPWLKDFKRDRQTKRCDSAFDFRTLFTGNGISTTRSTFTLGVPYGNTTSSGVSGAEFDRY